MSLRALRGWLPSQKQQWRTTTRMKEKIKPSSMTSIFSKIILPNWEWNKTHSHKQTWDNLSVDNLIHVATGSFSGWREVTRDRNWEPMKYVERTLSDGLRWRPPLVAVGNGSWLEFQPRNFYRLKTTAFHWLKSLSLTQNP